MGAHIGQNEDVSYELVADGDGGPVSRSITVATDPSLRRAQDVIISNGGDDQMYVYFVTFDSTAAARAAALPASSTVTVTVPACAYVQIAAVSTRRTAEYNSQNNENLNPDSEAAALHAVTWSGSASVVGKAGVAPQAMFVS